MLDDRSRQSRTLERVPDILIELYRTDLAFWGDWRTAAVVRCVAAANWRDGRPAKVTGIAATLDMGASTVHGRLAQLAGRADGPDGAAEPIVRRVAGGYVLTSAGEDKAQRWCTALAKTAAPLYAES
jgi:hypothetical protein